LYQKRSKEMAAPPNVFMRVFTTLHVGLYRLSGGKLGGGMAGLPLLVLTTTGRKSGVKRSNPLGYIEHDGGYVVTASNNGSDRNPGWYYNLRETPQAGVQIGRRVFSARAEEVSSDMRRKLWERLVGIAPGYKGYAKSTSRTIPMMILYPDGSSS
jgi:deazaflavin-dependent oxidoreductase (nitroreductase family)